LLACVVVNTYVAWVRMQTSRAAAAGFVSKDESTPLAFGINGGRDLDSPNHKLPWEIAMGVNAFLVAVVFILTGLLLGGSLVQANGYRSFPPRGNFVSLVSPSGHPLTVMVQCTGAANASQATIVFDVGGGGHSSTDLYGMQLALNDAGHRVCTYDYPGCGWSGYGDDALQPQILEQILTAINEPAPYILLGTMDGGPTRIYDYALRYPQNVRALVVIDYSPGPSEMEGYKIMRNYTDSQATEYAVETIQSRFDLGNIVRGLAVQWGLMSIFAPPGTTFVPASMQTEKLFLNLYNEKQWQTQVAMLARQIADPPLLFGYDLWATNRTLSDTIPVWWFYNNVNITRTCVDYAYTTTRCEEAQKSQSMTYPYIVQATNMTSGSKIIQYEDARDMLSQGQYIPWTVGLILENINSLL